ncbi:MAG: hypothetical protein PWR01_2730, partial [Clostridiales bacterium]|nr:hypothetical protein [Clostridiales bacterium]MDN5281657.1 hypothetical protein [Candidatus Ozemobacter sp.]
MILSLTTGCLFNTSSNPVGNSSVAESQQLAQKVAQTQPQIMASSFTQPEKRNYTFAKSGHKLSTEFRQNVKRMAGSLKVSLAGSTSTDNVLISFEKMKVKPENGAPFSVAIEERTIDLLSATDLADVIGDVELPEGVYKYME